MTVDRSLLIVNYLLIGRVYVSKPREEILEELEKQGLLLRLPEAKKLEIKKLLGL